MNTKQIKALFFDFDGTLVSYKNHQIHPEDFRNLKKLHEEGFKLFIASGRNLNVPAEAKSIEPLREIMDGYISVNGQHCEMADGTVISDYPVNEEDCASVIKCCSENHLALLYYHNNVPYVTEMTDLVKGFAEYVGLPEPSVRKLSPNDPTPVKLCVYITAADDDKLLKPLLKHTLTANNCDFISDLIPEGVGKDVGIIDTCNFLGIDPGETMAFGDGENDISMLLSAGIGVAMGIAPDNVKKAADHVTAAAEDAGISQALRYFGLID